MSGFLSVVVLLTLLVVGVWVVLFGVLGAIVGRRRGRSSLRGALLGVLAGPLALIWMMLRDSTDAVGPGTRCISDDTNSYGESLHPAESWESAAPWTSGVSPDDDYPF